MHFDPAIAALQAFQGAVEQEEFGDFEEDIIEAEETFSSDAGPEAKAAYQTLQDIGEKLPDARLFHEFLIYITWQQVTEETISRHFQKGVALCEQYLNRFGKDGDRTETHDQITSIYASFRAGLGETDNPVPEYDEDAFQGGD